MMVILFLLVIFIVLILIVPITFSAVFRFPRPQYVCFCVWGNFLKIEGFDESAKMHILGLNFEFSKKKEPEIIKEKKETVTAKMKTGIFNRVTFIFRLLLNQNLRGRWLHAFKKFLGAIFNAIHFKALSADIQMGLESPAETGMAMGFYYALRNTTEFVWPSIAQVNLTPDFVKKGFCGETEIKGRTSMIKLLFPFFVFLWHAPLYKTYRLVQEAK